MTYKIGDVLKEFRDFALTNDSGIIVKSTDGKTLRRINGRTERLLPIDYSAGYFLPVWQPSLTGDGPWTIVENPSKPAKPERKQLTAKEAHACITSVTGSYKEIRIESDPALHFSLAKGNPFGWDEDSRYIQIYQDLVFAESQG